MIWKEDCQSTSCPGNFQACVRGKVFTTAFPILLNQQVGSDRCQEAVSPPRELKLRFDVVIQH